ncbi:uncharacterized protein LOC144576378 [Callithrix jacchus]|nr:putative UPF0607 protein ENSP00000381418 [Callithrix jacchus]
MVSTCPCGLFSWPASPRSSCACACPTSPPGFPISLVPSVRSWALFSIELEFHPELERPNAGPASSCLEAPLKEETRATPLRTRGTREDPSSKPYFSTPTAFATSAAPILKTAVRAEEPEEPMEVDDQGLGVLSAHSPAGGVLPFGKPYPAPAVLPGPVPGCSHWPDKAASLVLGKDHQPSSWERTQCKDPPAVVTRSSSTPRATSSSSRQPKLSAQPQQLPLVPPQQWRWERDQGPPPAKRARQSLKKFTDNTRRSGRITSSRRLKKRCGKIKQLR